MAGKTLEDKFSITCPHCGTNVSRVIDSRTAPDGSFTRRRRRCEDCSQRFTTHESVVVVTKRGKPAKSAVTIAAETLARIGKQAEESVRLLRNLGQEVE